MGLFGPAWKSGNVNKAVKAVEKMTDESTLLTVVLECTTQARFAALERIHDSALLLRAAAESSDRNIYETALARVTDIAALKAFCAVEGKSHKGLSADKCLSRLLVEKADPATHQEDLKRVALNSAFYPEKAAQKLTKRADLIDVAIKAMHNAAKVAIDKLADDPAALDEVISRADKVRAKLALASVRDQAQLEKIALDCPKVDCRIDAVERLANKSVAARIALEDADDYVRMAATDCLDDLNTLKRIALQTCDDSARVNFEYVRLHAVKRINNPAVLAEIAMKSDYYKSNYARREALSRIVDPAALEQIARKNPGGFEPDVVRRLVNPMLLADLALDERCPENGQVAAVESLSDYGMVSKIAEESNRLNKYAVYKAACQRKETLEKELGLCPACGKALSDAELGACRCGTCGAEVHDYRFSEENVVSATEHNSYWSRDIYRVCRRCGKRVFYTKYEGWGTDVD